MDSSEECGIKNVISDCLYDSKHLRSEICFTCEVDLYGRYSTMRYCFLINDFCFNNVEVNKIDISFKYFFLIYLFFISSSLSVNSQLTIEVQSLP
jgi:hypothetical protein